LLKHAAAMDIPLIRDWAEWLIELAWATGAVGVI